MNGTITLNSALPTINKTVTIQGPGADNLTVERNANAAAFGIFSVGLNVQNVNIDSLTITGGLVNAVGGAGVFNDGVLGLANDIIDYNTANNCPGGGVYNAAGSTVVLNNTSIYLNQATQNGGLGAGIANFGNLYAEYSTIFSNEAGGSGGGIFNGGGSYAELYYSTTVYGNGADGNGGGVYNIGTFYMDGGTIYSNYSGIFGGGIFNGDKGSLTLGDGVIIGPRNQATSGGGLYLATGSTAILNTVTVQGNQLIGVGGMGAGIYQQNGANYTGVNVTDSDDPGGNPVKGP